MLRADHPGMILAGNFAGFYDQAAFSNQFKKHMGMTPMQYRKTYC